MVGLSPLSGGEVRVDRVSDKRMDEAERATCVENGGLSQRVRRLSPRVRLEASQLSGQRRLGPVAEDRD